MASEYRFIEFFEIFREGCFQGDFFFVIFALSVIFSFRVHLIYYTEHMIFFIKSA